LAHAEPNDAELSKALGANDLETALRIKTRQLEKRNQDVTRLREEETKLPRDYFELGQIHEARFEWPQALAAYRKAWEFGKNPDHGFKYASLACKLNHFPEAITAYEDLLGIDQGPSVRALTLNGLAIGYRATHRMQKAEQAISEALAIQRKFAETNSDAYLRDVAMTITLNNRAILYSDTQRMQEAGQASGEAERILDPLWRANPELYGDTMAKILWTRALITEARGEPGEACALARRGLGAAYDPDVRQSIQQIIDHLAPTPPASRAE
jgi:tetratricopeptide (TPR) repeat protein